MSMLVALRAVGLAAKYIGVTELTHNRGPLVDHWSQLAGADPKMEPAWCASFVYAMFHDAALALHLPNPCPRTAAVRQFSIRSGIALVLLPVPGAIFIIDNGVGKTHTGLVESVPPAGSTLVTLEGNTNAAGSREGNSVQRHTYRKISDCKGFLILPDVSGAPPLVA